MFTFDMMFMSYDFYGGGLDVYPVDCLQNRALELKTNLTPKFNHLMLQYHFPAHT